ncbi:MAG: response regulator [bacterium]
MKLDFSNAHILIVDDNERLRTQLANAMQRRRLVADTAADVTSALELLAQDTFDFAIVDLKMPGASGLELIREMSKNWPEVAVVMMTGYGSIATAVDAVKLGAVNYVQKPADADDLLAALERGLDEPLGDATQDYAAPSLARAEWEHIHRVLADCAGNISEAARRLGIHRRTLQRKLNAYSPRE